VRHQHVTLSSKPPDGYDADRLSDDVVAVIRTVTGKTPRNEPTLL
jgi:hypothetical protein